MKRITRDLIDDLRRSSYVEGIIIGTMISTVLYSQIIVIQIVAIVACLITILGFKKLDDRTIRDYNSEVKHKNEHEGSVVDTDL